MRASRTSELSASPCAAGPAEAVRDLWSVEVEIYTQSADTHERSRSKSASFGSTATAPAALAPSKALASHEVVRTIIGMHRVVSSHRNLAIKFCKVRSRALSSVTIK